MSTDKRKVSILGCGWLGLPLAKALIKDNFRLLGSTTSIDGLSKLEHEGIEAYHIDIQSRQNSIINKAFFDTDILILNIPPKVKSKGLAFHPEQIKNICSLLKAAKLIKLIYISSTSVYPDQYQNATEKDEVSGLGGNESLIQAESILSNDFHGQLSIFRLAGLVGYDRIPGKRMARRKVDVNGNQKVNLIHRDDVIQIIRNWLQSEVNGNTTVNIAAPKHPTKKEVYEAMAKKYGFEPPQFGNEEKAFKIVSSSLLTDKYGYDFLHPDPLKF